MVTWSVNADAQSCLMYSLSLFYATPSSLILRMRGKWWSERASERALPLDGMTVFISFRERLRKREGDETWRRPSAAQCSLCLRDARTHSRTATLDCAEENSFGCCAVAAAAASVMTCGRSAHCISTNTRATERERTTVFRKMPFPCLLATLALYVEDGGGGVVRPPIVVKVKPIAL